MANDVAIRRIADPVGNYPVTQQWLDHLGMDSLPEHRTEACVRALALAALRDDRLASESDLLLSPGRYERDGNKQYRRQQCRAHRHPAI